MAFSTIVRNCVAAIGVAFFGGAASACATFYLMEDATMKKTITFLLALVMMLSLAACGGGDKPKGTYTAYVAEIPFAQLSFSGNKVEYKTLGLTEANGEITKGTFTMDGTTVNISYENGNSDTFVYDKDKDSLDYFGMGLMTFTKSK